MKLKRVDQPVEKSYPHYNDVNSGHMLKHLIIGASLTVAVSVAGCGKKESSREKEGDSSDNMNPPAKKVEPAKKQEPAKNNVDTSTPQKKKRWVTTGGVAPILPKQPKPRDMDQSTPKTMRVDDGSLSNIHNKKFPRLRGGPTGVTPPKKSPKNPK